MAGPTFTALGVCSTKCSPARAAVHRPYRTGSHRRATFLRTDTIDSDRPAKRQRSDRTGDPPLAGQGPLRPLRHRRRVRRGADDRRPGGRSPSRTLLATQSTATRHRQIGILVAAVGLAALIAAGAVLSRGRPERNASITSLAVLPLASRHPGYQHRVPRGWPDRDPDQWSLEDPQPAGDRT